jgi:NADH-quinone oxidoreductase subunit M
VTKAYAVEPGSAVSVFILAVGAVTLLLAAMMALHQKNLKKLLAYAAIGQAGYVFLGVGTGLAAGAAGGMLQTMSHAAVTGGLFVLAGAVEQKMGTADLDHIGGLGKKAPVLAACGLLCGLSMIGFPGLPGFFPKNWCSARICRQARAGISPP